MVEQPATFESLARHRERYVKELHLEGQVLSPFALSHLEQSERSPPDPINDDVCRLSHKIVLLRFALWSQPADPKDPVVGKASRTGIPWDSQCLPM